MAYYPPRHPDDAFLFEVAYDEQGKVVFEPDGKCFKFSDRAQQAQDAKWERMFKRFHPIRILNRSYVASPDNVGKRLPHLAYGWAYKRDFLMKYALRHKLAVSLGDGLKKELGKDSITYGELSEEEAKNKVLCGFLKGVVGRNVHRDLEKRAGAKLFNKRPFTRDYDRMFALWTNHDAVDRQVDIQVSTDISRVVSVLQEAMTEDGHETELLWWYDWEELHADLSSPY